MLVTCLFCPWSIPWYHFHLSVYNFLCKGILPYLSKMSALFFWERLTSVDAFKCSSSLPPHKQNWLWIGLCLCFSEQPSPASLWLGWPHDMVLVNVYMKCKNGGFFQRHLKGVHCYPSSSTGWCLVCVCLGFRTYKIFMHIMLIVYLQCRKRKTEGNQFPRHCVEVTRLSWEWPLWFVIVVL